MNKFIGLDCETGGLTQESSLLTVFFGIYDENLVLVDELYLYVKPDDGVYRVTAKALEINRINLVEHDRIAIPYKEAKTVLYQFLQRSYQDTLLIPVGHGVTGDIDWVHRHISNKGSWEGFVSYRKLDTSNVVQFLRAAGIFPDDVSGSMESLVKYFGLPSIGDLHDAKVDTLQTVSVLKRLLALIKPINEITISPERLG
jgi:hypothetical protein